MAIMKTVKKHIIKAINHDYTYRILFYYEHKSKAGFSNNIKIKIAGIIMRSIVEYLR